MVDLLDEIKEDIEKQRLNDIWRTYGKWVIGGAISIIVFTAFIVWFQEYQHRSSKENGSFFYLSLQKIDKERSSGNKNLSDQFSDIYAISQSDSPYAPLATLHYAQHLIDSNQRHEAVRLLSSTSSIDNTHLLYELINLLAISHQASIANLDDKDIQKLTYLSRDNGPWHFLAQEQLLLHTLREQDWATAHRISEEIINNSRVPYSIRQRIVEIRHSLPSQDSLLTESDTDHTNTENQ